MEEIYGGLSRDREGLPVPAIMGRLCQWKSPRAPATFASYADFKSSLNVKCQETGEPGVLRSEMRNYVVIVIISRQIKSQLQVFNWAKRQILSHLFNSIC